MPSAAATSGHKTPLTYHQRQLAREQAMTNRRAIKADVDAVLHHINVEAKRLGKKYRRTPAWFQHQFHQGGRVVRQKRAVSVFNAARQIEAFLDGRKGVISEEDKEQFIAISAEIVKLNGVENASKLPAPMQLFLKMKAQAWRDQKHSAPRANNRAVVQDATQTLQSISSELVALTARTNMQTILFAVKGKGEHTIQRFVATSEKGGRFITHGMKKHAANIAEEFEAYVLGDVHDKSRQGVAHNHNGRLAELKGKIRTCIREGLVSITGDAKASMQFNRYEKSIVVEKGVALINWPEDIPFKNASEIGSLHVLRRLLAVLSHDDPDERCQWVQLSKEEWEKRKDAYYKADDEAPLRTRKRTRRPAGSEYDGSEGESSDDEGAVEPGPSKRSRKQASEKENETPAGSSTDKAKEKRTGQKKVETEGAKQAEKAKDKAALCQGSANKDANNASVNPSDAAQNAPWALDGN
ncbi:hypothetical protein K439DRAFT_1659287 [Ramaria rubella]|nr:hypothetical protein K439DRAFT_1659287 [Ramaria rubella]